MLVLLAFALLVGLGVWQLQRKAWKEHLLARIAALQAAPPEPLSVVLNRVKDGGELDFVRVVAPCAALGPRAPTSTACATATPAAPGWRQIAACQPRRRPLRLHPGRHGLRRHARPRPAGGRADDRRRSDGVRLTGVLRSPEPRPWYAGLIGLGAPAHPASQASGQWFERDIPGMAAVLGAPRPAPVMLMLESPAAGPRLHAVPLPTDIPNHHLEYALTWFGLAATLVVFYAVALLRGRRARG